jgi:two-component system phosphate regulon response regulator PhoB
MNNKTILIIDDEKDLLELVRYNLEKEGYDAICAADGETGLEIATRHKPALILLDLMMPGKDGLEVCRQLRSDHRTNRVPIIMLTAKATEADRVVGLELGADDYVVKPFSPRELVARVKAVLRRSASQQEPAATLGDSELSINLSGHEVTAFGQRVQLTATEFRILQFLASRPGKVSSRDEIIDAALGRDTAIFDRTIDVHITSIRRKLGKAGEKIETVRGFGYKFREAVTV